MGRDLSRRGGHRIQPRLRLAVDDLGGRAHHAARRQSRQHADPGRAAGGRKSTALNVLASDAWFTDELAATRIERPAQQMRGVWIIEMAELDAIGKAEVSRIKAFLSRTTDRYRPPYERYVITVPRQCVFAGSVNADTYLRDETGNRRFWPVRCGEIDLEALLAIGTSFGPKPSHGSTPGPIWWLEDKDLAALAEVAQEARYQPDAWDGLIERWLNSERLRVNVGFGATTIGRTSKPPSRPLTTCRSGRSLSRSFGSSQGSGRRVTRCALGPSSRRRSGCGIGRPRSRVNGATRRRGIRAMTRATRSLSHCPTCAAIYLEVGHEKVQSNSQLSTTCPTVPPVPPSLKGRCERTEWIGDGTYFPVWGLRGASKWDRWDSRFQCIEIATIFPTWKFLVGQA